MVRKTPVGDDAAAAPKGGERARSKDGDTFVLSAEARAMQAGRAAEIAIPVSGNAATLSAGDGKAGARRHVFPQLSDPQDVADRLVEGLDKEYAAQRASEGGREAASKAGFAEGIRKRLDGWNAAPATGATEAFLEFRGEVHWNLASALDAWAASDAHGL